jgi:hypothetical protein
MHFPDFNSTSRFWIKGKHIVNGTERIKDQLINTTATETFTELFYIKF